jgi:plastocyanin
VKKVVSVIAAIGVAGGVAALPATGATNKTVRVKDSYFSPRKLTIKKGAKVTWVWRGQERHNIATAKGPTNVKFAGRRKGKRSYTFKRRGTWRLVCTIHAPDMNMRIVVK